VDRREDDPAGDQSRLEGAATRQLGDCALHLDGFNHCVTAPHKAPVAYGSSRYKGTSNRSIAQALGATTPLAGGPPAASREN
jgi:hypothetical protein